MKITLLRKNLNEALKIASPAISNQADLAILSNFLIRADKNMVYILATDLEIGVTIKVRGKIDEPGEITIPAQIFSEFISNSSQERITLETEKDTMRINDGRNKASIKGQPTEDYPQIPDINEEQTNSISITGEKIYSALNRVLTAPTKDDSRPVLSGILFELEGSSLKLVATDSYRLAEEVVSLEDSSSPDSKTKVVAPLKACQELSRILEKETESSLEIIFSQNQIGFQVDNKILVSRLIEGDYPDYKQIIPNSFKTKTVLNRKEFLTAAKTAWLFSRDQANNVKLKIEDDELVILATSPQIGESKSKISLEKKSGPDVEISFNIKFITDILNAISSEKIEFKLNNSIQPGMIKEKDREDFLYLIMPLKTDQE
jgi:DNA polymerase-3 subunit beta